MLTCAFSVQSSAQEVENNYQYRFGIDLNWDLVKNLKLSVAPQLRFEDGFQRIQFEAGLRYKTFGFLYWGASFRAEIEPSDVDNEPADKYGRYAFNVMARKKFGDFTPSVRVMYTNYTNESVTDSEFMRYKGAVKYDIPKCKITPFVSVEAFQAMDENMLHKMRYSTGFDLKVKKGRYLNVGYMFDYFILDYKNRHIFELGYSFDF